MIAIAFVMTFVGLLGLHYVERNYLYAPTAERVFVWIFLIGFALGSVGVVVTLWRVLP